MLEIDPANEMYQFALHAAPSGIMVVTSQGKIKFLNQTLADMFGYDIDELTGAPVEVLLPRHYAAAHRQHVSKFAEKTGRSFRLKSDYAPSTATLMIS